MKQFVGVLCLLLPVSFAYFAAQRIGTAGLQAAVMFGVALAIIAPVCVIIGYALRGQGMSTPIVPLPDPPKQPQPNFIIMPPGQAYRELPAPPTWAEAPGPLQIEIVGDDNEP